MPRKSSIQQYIRIRIHSKISDKSYRAVKYAKSGRKFQKPGVTHNHPETLPPTKLEQSSAATLISNRLNFEKDSINGVFKSFFDVILKDKKVNSFDEEMKKFRNCLDDFVQAPKLTEKTEYNPINDVIAWIEQGNIIPDIRNLENLLRACANAGEASKAKQIVLKMAKIYGVKATNYTKELLAYAYYKSGNSDEAFKILASLDKVSTMGQFVVWKMIRDALSKDQSEAAWELFDGLRSRVLPAPEICGSMLMNCGKNDLVEKAFKTYRELQAQGLEPNWITHSALIYAASKRKSFYEKAMALYREMESRRMSIDIRVYNNLLYATSKVGDLETALELWNLVQDNDKLQINDISIANMLWTLAAVETLEDKISKRPYHYDADPAELKAKAQELIKLAKESEHIALNAYILNGYLAVLANHNFVDEAESIFWDEFKSHHLAPTPGSYEIMFKMYDFSKDFTKTKELLEHASEQKVVLGFEAWRAAVRTAAITGNLTDSIDWLRQMVKAGYRPSVTDLKVLHLRLCENEKWELRKQMGELCLPVAKVPNNPYTNWRLRSIALADLLAQVYGKNAPKLATKADKIFKYSA